MICSISSFLDLFLVDVGKVFLLFEDVSLVFAALAAEREGAGEGEEEDDTSGNRTVACWLRGGLELVNSGSEAVLGGWSLFNRSTEGEQTNLAHSSTFEFVLKFLNKLDVPTGEELVELLDFGSLRCNKVLVVIESLLALHEVLDGVISVIGEDDRLI